MPTIPLDVANRSGALSRGSGSGWSGSGGSGYVGSGSGGYVFEWSGSGRSLFGGSGSGGSGSGRSGSGGSGSRGFESVTFWFGGCIVARACHGTSMCS